MPQKAHAPPARGHAPEAPGSHCVHTLAHACVQLTRHIPHANTEYTAGYTHFLSTICSHTVLTCTHVSYIFAYMHNYCIHKHLSLPIFYFTVGK